MLKGPLCHGANSEDPVCTVRASVFALSLGVIGRLRSVIVALPGHHLLQYPVY